MFVAETHLNPWRLYLDSAASRRSDLPVEARRPRVWRWESPRAAGLDDERQSFLPRCEVSLIAPERQLVVSSKLIKRRPFAARFTGADAAVRSHGRDG